MSVVQIVACVLLALAPWRLVRWVVRPSFRIAFFREAPLVVGVLVAYALAVITLARAAPGVLPWLAVPAAIALAAVELHGRAARGRRRGWPPGRLEIPSFGPWLDRDYLFAQQRRYGCPFKANQYVRPMVCFVGLAEGGDFLRTYDDALSSPPLWFGRFIAGGLMRHMEPARHEATREVLRAAFGREVFGPLEPFMRDCMRGELARMAAASAASAGAGIAPRPHLQRLMFALWLRLFFDVGAERPEFARLKTLFHVIDIRKPRRIADRRIAAALAEITRIVTARPVAGGSGVLAAIAQRRPDAIGDPSVTGNLIYEMHITWADLSGFLQWLLWMLVAHPEWLARVRADVETGTATAESSLASRVVSETLRLEQSEHVYRKAERDIAYRGMTIPRGWLVRLCVRESHRDPEIFPDPDVFDPDRFRDRAYARREYSPFGHGRHACLGEGLARHVGRLFVEEVASGWDWRTVVDGPVEQGSWRHWRPSSRWRVLVAPAAGERGAHTLG